MMSLEKDLDGLAAALLDGLNKRDPEALLTLVHADYEFYSRLAAVDGRTYRGPQGFIEYFRDLDEGFTDLCWTLEEIGGRRGDDVMLVFRFSARGRASGTPVEFLAPQVWTFRDGKLWRNVIYASRAEALEAMGLRE